MKLHAGHVGHDSDGRFSGSESLTVHLPSVESANARISPSNEAVFANQHRALARRFYEDFWNAGNFDIAAQLFSQNLEIANAGEDWPRGIEGAVAVLTVWRQAFPDMVESPDIVVADGQYAMSFFTFEGTHRGPFMGVSATGRRVTMHGADCFRFDAGLITEWRFVEDRLRLAEQLNGVQTPFSPPL